MKRFQINTAKMLLPALLAVILFACVRKDNFFPSNSPSTRQALVKILDGGTPPTKLIKLSTDFVSAPKVLVVDLRRDCNDQADLNTSMTVVVKDDTAAVTAADPNYQKLPAAWYTLQSESPRVGGSGGTFTFVFKPGEFAKQIYLTIPNANLLDPNALYAICFTITSVNDNGRISDSKSRILQIGETRNAYDGIYAVTGPVVDAANPDLVQFNDPTWDAFTGSHGGAWEAALKTINGSPTLCYVIDSTVWGCAGHPLHVVSSGNASGYGSMGIVIQFDPATNKVAKIWNYYGDPAMGGATGLGNPATGSGSPNFAASNTRTISLDPSGVNAVQTNKDILIKYFMYQPSVIAGVRTTFNETWKYIGPR